MKLSGLSTRLSPLLQKVRGALPLCPWRSVLNPIDPRTLAGHPPLRHVEIVRHHAGRQEIRFGDRHSAWFPEHTEITDEMWSEYLAVFWDHPANAHRYLTAGTPIRRGDVCIDCGSCEGFFAFQALEAGASRVVCIEPNPEMVACLNQTFARQIDDGSVIIRQGAVGAMEGEANFSSNLLNPFGGAVEKAVGVGQIVRLETLAAICADLNLERVDFVKMDIEGAELQAVEGALPILRRHRPRLAITTYHRSFHYAALAALLRAAGYRHVRPAGITDRHGGTFRPVMLHAWS